MGAGSILAGEVAFDFVAHDKVTPVAGQVKKALRDPELSPSPELPGKFDQLGAAMGRMERREPMMVMRQMRGEIDLAAASALGAAGPMGRFAGTLALFAGGTGLVAGIAVVGLEIKKIIDFTAALDKNLQAVTDKFAAMVPMAKRFSEIAATRQGLADVGAQVTAGGVQATEPGFLTKALVGLRAGTGLQDIGAAMQSQADVGAATSQNMLFLQMAEMRKARVQEQETRERALNLAMGEANISLEKARLGTSATKVELADLAEKTALLRIATSAATPPMKAHLEQIERHVALYERATAAAEDFAKEFEQGVVQKLKAVPQAQVLLQPGIGILGGIATGRNAPGLESPGAAERERAAQRRSLGLEDVTGAGTTPIEQTMMGGQPGSGKPEKAAKDAGEKMGRLVGEMFAHVVAAATAGTTRARQIIAQAFATKLNKITQDAIDEAVKSGGLSKMAGGILGGLAGAAVGLISGLFTSGPPAVMIDGYSSKAMNQQQQLMLALVGFRGLGISILSAGGGDLSGVVNLIGRQSASDGSLRLPPGNYS